MPNDATNEGRALLLLQDLACSPSTRTPAWRLPPTTSPDNPHNLQFQEMDAAMLPQTIEEVDFSIINSNYALDAGLNPTTDALATRGRPVRRRPSLRQHHRP